MVLNTEQSQWSGVKKDQKKKKIRITFDGNCKMETSFRWGKTPDAAKSFL